MKADFFTQHLCSSEIFAKFYKNAGYNILEGCHFHTHCPDTVKSQLGEGILLEILC
jgi:hypothetical protein